MNQKLGTTAREEIRAAMNGLTGKAAKAEAERLATIFPMVSVSHIYTMTKDVRPSRKRRSDSGRRKFDIVEGTDTFEVAALVLGGRLNPKEALDTVKANGHASIPTLGTMRRLLRDKGLGGKQRKYGRRNYRRFEAAAPLDMIQIDCTALKVRWLDVKTRRILRIEGIDKNHPQMDPGKLRVWQIMAVDDHSRRKFLRYVVTSHITSRDMVTFCCDLFGEWGMPIKVYTDNGPEFKGFFNQATQILASIPAVAASGGYEHLKHKPNNPQASGKVENAHKWAEKMDRYIGLAEQKGLEVTADKLNDFADAICRSYNHAHVNRSTGETPVARWFGRSVTMRMLPQEVIRAALLFDEAERVLTDAMTVRVGKIEYRIPARDEAGKASPFRAGMKLKVIVPHELDQIFVTLANGEEYQIDKVLATPDVAGEFRQAAAAESEVLTDKLKKHHQAKNTEAKEKKRLTGEVYRVPHFNHEIALPETNIRHFPHPEIAITAAEVNVIVPVADSALHAPHSALNFWQALDLYKDRFETGIVEAKEFLLTLFPDQQGTATPADIESAIENRHEQPRRLQAVS